MSDRLACVVMSLGCEPGLVAAVRSLRAESEELELVVVNSGGGEPSSVLERAGLGDVPVVEHPEPLYPGAVRNLGIGATTARWVSFLAADCVAEPGWVAGRLRRHAGGAPVVASAVTNAYPGSAVASASYLLLFHTRMPDARAAEQRLFGASYDRGLFERYGLFRDDLRAGEDSELHGRFAYDVEIAWTPEVRTAHRHATGLGSALREHFARGRRAAATLAERHDGDWRAAIARAQAHNVRAGARAGWTSAPTARARAAIVGALPLMTIIAGAYVAGALADGR